MKTPIERVPTGIPLLDRVLQGGLPKGSINLLSGACGTGKTIFGMQYLYEGALRYGEPGLYITLEENPEDLIRNMKTIGMDLQPLINQKKLMVIKPDVYKFESIKRVINDSIDRIHATRLVVDSYSVMLTYFNDTSEIRNGLVQLDRAIKKFSCTALILSDVKDNSDVLSTTGLEEFIVDGVIVLYLIRSTKPPYMCTRTVLIRKMRGTDHPLQMFPFHIHQGGIRMDGDRGRGPGNGKGTGEAGKRAGGPTKSNSLTLDLEQLGIRRQDGHRLKWKHL